VRRRQRDLNSGGSGEMKVGGEDTSAGLVGLSEFKIGLSVRSGSNGLRPAASPRACQLS
jgi:hypothetical protein